MSKRGPSEQSTSVRMQGKVCKAKPGRVSKKRAFVIDKSVLKQRAAAKCKGGNSCLDNVLREDKGISKISRSSVFWFWRIFEG